MCGSDRSMYSLFAPISRDKVTADRRSAADSLADQAAPRARPVTLAQVVGTWA